MGNTATIEHKEATTTKWGFDPETKQAVLLNSETGPRTQEYDRGSLAAAAKCCPTESEGHAMYSQRAAALVEQAPTAQSTPGAPSAAMKRSPT